MLSPRTILHVCLLTAAMHGEETLTLREALEQTSRLNPDLAVSRLRTIEAAANLKATQSGFQPQVNLSVQQSYQTSNLQGIGLIFPGFPSRIGPYRAFNARPQVTQNVLDLALLTQIRASRARRDLTELDVRALRDDLAIAVVDVYLQALQAQSRLAASKARIATAEAILEQAQAKEQTGTGSKLDVARALDQLESERILEIEAKRDGQVLQTILLRTIGREQIADGAMLRLEKPGFALFVENEVQRSAQNQRPDLLALQARAKVAGLERQAIDQQKMPRVTAFADYGLLGAGLDRSIGTYAVGVAVTVPLWTGRRIESESAAGQARQDQVTQQVRRLSLQIQQEIRQAALELQAAREALQAAERGAAASQEILELSRLRLQSGLTSSVDTQIAQSGLAVSEDRRIRAEYQMLLSSARLAKAGGSISSDTIR
jgi:outer membrane protein